MKKKWLPVLLAAAMTVSLAACSAAATGTSQQAASETAATQEAQQAASETATTQEAQQAASEAETAQTEETTAGEKRVFTDSVGREVEVDAKIERVAISGPLAQIVVFALAPDKLVGIANEWDPRAEQYLDTKYYNLTLLGQLYGGKGELNLEELLSVAPQVVIDVGEPKGTIVEDLDALQEQTGIPFVHVTATISTMDEAYTMLGDLLGMEDEAAELAAYCRQAYDDTLAIAGRAEKVNLLYITGEQGLNVIAKSSYHAEVIDMLSNNLAEVDEPSAKGSGNEVDMEQILNWNPDVIIFSPDSIYDTVDTLDEWQTITAIQNGEYYEVPFGPYNWMGFPPSVQRILGMQWMAKLLYPEEADYDLYEVAAEYFELFYHCDLSGEQFEELVEHSLQIDAE
ncbi:MAG: ABC transporter substrate-binding protein [Lachnospiraceae bacterium]|nr:ABC transporter substrate-binding protein [Lachnospiraceae bacterium]